MTRITCRLPYGPSAVLVDGEPAPFSRSLALRNHSPTGFAWGYGGSGPGQTALAILLAVLDEQKALALYMDFKWDHVSLWPQTDHETEIDIEAWAQSKRAEGAIA